jgi:hypothetical protein
MGMTSASTPPAAALVADAIARIEERRDVLDRLARKGMEMVERLAAGEDVEIAGRKPFADPARAFAVISRAVRLCLALGCRLDQEIIALLRGGPIPTLAILAPEAPAALKTSAAEPETPVPASGPRERIARAIDAVIEAETADREAAERQCRGTSDRRRGLRRLPPPALAGRGPDRLRRPRPPSRLERLGQHRGVQGREDARESRSFSPCGRRPSPRSRVG